MTLFDYKKKRNLKISKEPPAKISKKKSDNLIFVIQEHHARSLHYDFRLEVRGQLKSWAVPKEPSMNPAVKRLAIMVEDHPYAYKDFEGTIPAGYGAGTVKIWDKGTYSVDDLTARQSEDMILKGLKKGVLHFSLHGKKMKGTFSLIQLKNSKKNQWLFIKKREDKKGESEKKFLTNLDKIYWPKEKITKGDLLSYYEKMAPWILPYLKDRPESLRRFPNGIKGETFFQKNLQDHPTWIKTVMIPSKDKEVNYLLIQNEESLLFAANLGCIELHPFFSRVKKIHSPDFLIFDLDPKGASFDKVIKVAQTIHEILEELDVASYCKTSGATGLHIAVPLGAKYTYEKAKEFAEQIARLVVQRLPTIATVERSLSKRKGKVYVDCQQNNLGQTLAAPYSVRARPGAPVSTPLQWKEVKKGLDPKKFTMHTIFSRLAKLGDLFAPVLKKGVNLKNIRKKFE